MNITKKNTVKYIPKIIEFDYSLYIGFINEKDVNEQEFYHKFSGTKGLFRDRERYLKTDKIHKISLGLYFKISCELIKNGIKYNLNKFKHELNNR